MLGCMACSLAAAAAAARGRCAAVTTVVTAAVCGEGGGGRKASARRWPPCMACIRCRPLCMWTEDSMEVVVVELVGNVVEVGRPLEKTLGTTVAVMVSSP